RSPPSHLPGLDTSTADSNAIHYPVATVDARGPPGARAGVEDTRRWRVRIAELSRVTGVPIPTIKYYIRSGLLPAGDRTSWNQAQYDETHARRLRLVRALIEVGGLSVAATRQMLDSISTPGLSLFGTLGKAQYA